jgi:hypothetical protein
LSGKCKQRVGLDAQLKRNKRSRIEGISWKNEKAIENSKWGVLEESIALL